jgi:hypothetical protein
MGDNHAYPETDVDLDWSVGGSNGGGIHSKGCRGRHIDHNRRSTTPCAEGNRVFPRHHTRSRIEVSGIDDGKLHSPLHFRVGFRAFGGSTIDLSTLAVTYLRGPNIDLTQRIKTFVQPAGIDIPDAEVPPGEHAIRIELKDSEGRRATTNFILAVAPD